MNVTVDIQVACGSDESPDPHEMRGWLLAALTGRLPEEPSVSTEVSIRIVDRDESRLLNRTYRQQDHATNVLSFPSDLPLNIPLRHLGDIVICAPVVAEEARQQQKLPTAHWAHMVVHGALHLLGYDHIEEAEASVMESLETDILTSLNLPPPYAASQELAANSA